MAWTNIDNSLVSVGALPFATTIQALRDNPVAIANGDVGAPKVQAAALDTGTDERDWVLARTAGASVGAVGTYAYGSISVPGATVREPGYTTAISYAGSPAGTTSAAPGTWRLMGRLSNPTGDSGTFASVFLRIA